MTVFSGKVRTVLYIIYIRLLGNFSHFLTLAQFSIMTQIPELNFFSKKNRDNVLSFAAGTNIFSQVVMQICQQFWKGTFISVGKSGGHIFHAYTSLFMGILYREVQQQTGIKITTTMSLLDTEKNTCWFCCLKWKRRTNDLLLMRRMSTPVFLTRNTSKLYFLLKRYPYCFKVSSLVDITVSLYI